MNDDVKRIRKLGQLYAFTAIQMHEAIGQKQGFSGTDHKYLGFFFEKGAMTAGELAKLTGLTTGAVTGLIDRFEKKKLVKRRFSEDDRRKVMIVPDIEKIMDLFVPLYKDYRTKTEELIGSFSTAEIKTIEAYFSKAIELMQETRKRISKN